MDDVHMDEVSYAFLTKAEESLAGAESEFGAGRYNNCVNRCYYSCFQATVAALQNAGVRPNNGEWSHKFVQIQFSGLLIHRRKVYASSLNDVLPWNFSQRLAADYGTRSVNQANASRAIRSTRRLVEAIRLQEGNS